MDPNKVREVAAALADTYEALANLSEGCDPPTAKPVAIEIDKNLAVVDDFLTGQSTPSDEDFLDDLVDLICSGQTTLFKFSLSDNSVITFNIAWGDIDLHGASSEAETNWNDLQREMGNSHRTTGTHSAKLPDVEDAESLPPPAWDDDPLLADSILPPFYLPEEYDGVEPVFFQIMLGHPLRPVLLMASKSAPSRVATVGEDTWPIYGWPVDTVVWWEDSPEEEFNEAAERALDRLGAIPTSEVEIDGEIRTIYELPDTWRSGLLADDHVILEVFLEEEEKIDDDLSYVPSKEEVLADVSEIELPDDNELIDYNDARKLPELASAVESEESEFKEPELRLVEGLRYHMPNRRRLPR